MAELIVSDMLRRVAPSPTVAITQKARELRAEGRDVIALSVGEPDFDTPDHIKLAARDAIDRGETNYTAVDGLPALKRAIMAKFERDNGLTFTPEECVATSGGKYLIYAALMATLNPGDEVIVPAPYWVSYPDLVRMTGAEPKIVPAPAEQGFILDPETLKKAITKKTRWLILNSPSNPTGAVYTRKDLEAIADVLRSHPHVWLMTDDLYEHVLFDAEFFTLPQIAPDLKDRTLIVNGVSKAYAMTGWRLGFGAGPAALMKEITKLLGQTTTNPSSISQWAAVAALNGPHDFLKPRNEAFRSRRDKLVAGLNNIAGISCLTPEGAFYVYPSCADLMGRKYNGKKLKSDLDFAEALLEDQAVAVVPGTAFGLGPHFRISYATSQAELDDAVSRLAAFVAKLS